jgi:hypothetical protein
LIGRQLSKTQLIFSDGLVKSLVAIKNTVIWIRLRNQKFFLLILTKYKDINAIGMTNRCCIEMNWERNDLVENK